MTLDLNEPAKELEDEMFIAANDLGSMAPHQAGGWICEDLLETVPAPQPA